MFYEIVALLAFILTNEEHILYSVNTTINNIYYGHT